MKTFTLFTIIVILLSTNQMFSQANNKLKLRPDNLLQERIIPNSIQDEIAGRISESDIFKSKVSKTIINKTVLDTVFLLVEELWQEWDGSNWVNSQKIVLSYIIIVGVEQLTDGIKAYNLSNNYPNPFNPSTTISYSVPEIEFVTLKVYDVLGSDVVTLINEEKVIGSYEVEFNATNLPSGIYFYRLQAGSFVETKKMILLK